MIMDLIIDQLTKARDRWDRSEYKYLVIDIDGKILYSNDLDCNGYRYFNLKSLNRCIDQLTKGE